MRIRAEMDGRTARLSLRGALADGAGDGALREAVAWALAAGARKVIIDASRVSFLDAAGLGELVASREAARRAGSRLVLRGARGKTRELLRLTGLDRVLLPRASTPSSDRSARLRIRVA